jgi:hypothetical protein
MKTQLDIARQRLTNQHLLATKFTLPDEVVASLGAVQAQDYSGAKWAVGQRMRDASDATIDDALADGSIIRTHVLRPTWHFVTPADIRWMLALTAPRVNAAMAYYDRLLELTPDVYRRSNSALAKALRDGQQLTRPELNRVLQGARVGPTGAQRMGHLMMRAELDAIVCSGARRGKQFTYALLDDRVPPAPARARDESLLVLTKRDFGKRGPATPQDFAGWSGLTVADAKRGIQMAGSWLAKRTVEGRDYWLSANSRASRRSRPTAHLLPNYDEYFIGFKDRGAAGQRLRAFDTKTVTAALWAHVVAVDGQMVGGWTRTLEKGAVVVNVKPLARLSQADKRLIAAAAKEYGAFLQLPVKLRLA